MYQIWMAKISSDADLPTEKHLSVVSLSYWELQLDHCTFPGKAPILIVRGASSFLNLVLSFGDAYFLCHAGY
jgi:hypothetical protein